MTQEEKIDNLIDLQVKNEIMIADLLTNSIKALDSIKRLERIAMALTVNYDDMEARLTLLEQKVLARKPQ